MKRWLLSGKCILAAMLCGMILVRDLPIYAENAGAGTVKAVEVDAAEVNPIEVNPTGKNSTEISSSPSARLIAILPVFLMLSNSLVAVFLIRPRLVAITRKPSPSASFGKIA